MIELWFFWQIFVVLSNAGKSCGVRSVCVYGGTSKHPQISALESGVVRLNFIYLSRCIFF